MGENKPVAIDLFCGAGGLTLGLKKAGFEVLVGVESSPEIARTYEYNHRKTKVLIKDVRKVTGYEILKLARRKRIDIVAGCPPCQGFSQLTEKWKRRDPRNDLVLEMARIVEEIKPRMVMMENVPGIATKGKRILDEFKRKLEKLGYVINDAVLQMADYGVPQSRRRFVLLAGLGFEIPLPKATHDFKADSTKKVKQWVPISKVIRNMPKPVTLSHAMKHGGPNRFNWHVLRDLRSISIKRLRATKAGQDRSALPNRLRPECHRGNDHGFQNVYGRMSWNRVSPTITTGCTTPCMGRFGHPDKLRTISIREAALIQTFPERYRFMTKYMDFACDLVGNALPPKFAKKVAKVCVDALESGNGVKNG